jgi:hypothetical protein
MPTSHIVICLRMFAYLVEKKNNTGNCVSRGFPKFSTLLEVSRGFVFSEVFYLARSFLMFCISRSFVPCSKFPEVLYFPKFSRLLEVSRGFVFPEVLYLARSFPMFCISRSFLDCSKFPEVLYFPKFSRLLEVSQCFVFPEVF